MTTATSLWRLSWRIMWPITPRLWRL